MNYSIPKQSLPPPLLEGRAESTPPKKSINAAVWLRWLGAFAVVSSAVVYMLEGLHTSADELRNWIYLSVMGLMAIGGLVSGTFLRDSKGARVFFGLAMLLVPVQFSQIASQLHDGMIQAGTNASVLDWLGATLASITLPLLATIACVLPISYAGSTVLARNDKTLVCCVFLALCISLLVPARDSLVGYLVLVTIVCATLWLKRRLFDGQSVYKNLDGVGLRIILATPLIIAFVRLLTHIDDLAGLAGIMGFSAFALTRASTTGTAGTWGRFIGAALGILSWWVFLTASTRFGSVDFSLYFWPLAIWLLDIARLAKPHGRDYRITAMGFVIASATCFLLSTNTAGANFYALAHGLVALTWGVLNNQREPMMVGAPIALVSVIAISADALSGIQVNGWIALGSLGIALVFGASLWERYGANWTDRSRRAWQSIDDWQGPV